MRFVLLILIHWIAIYPVDTVIYLLNNWALETSGPRRRRALRAISKLMGLHSELVEGLLTGDQKGGAGSGFRSSFVVGVVHPRHPVSLERKKESPRWQMYFPSLCEGFLVPLDL